MKHLSIQRIQIKLYQQITSIGLTVLSALLRMHTIVIQVPQLSVIKMQYKQKVINS